MKILECIWNPNKQDCNRNLTLNGKERVLELDLNLEEAICIS